LSRAGLDDLRSRRRVSLHQTSSFDMVH